MAQLAPGIVLASSWVHFSNGFRRFSKRFVEHFFVRRSVDFSIVFRYVVDLCLVEGVLACPANDYRRTSIFLRMGDVLHAFFKVVRRRANEKQMDGPIENRSPSRSKKHRRIHAKSIAKSIDGTIEQTIETRLKKLRKSRFSGRQNRASDRPGDPKSSPGGVV